MTQIFAEDGTVIPNSYRSRSLHGRSAQNDRDRRLQRCSAGFGEIKEHKVNKPLKGHYKNASLAPHRYLREVELEDGEEVKVGDVVKADLFKEGDLVDVTGTSKGHGYTCLVKMKNYAIAAKAHGSKYHRGVGSLGSIGPARIFKGRPMPSRWGSDRVTIQNLEVVKVDAEKNLLLVKGSVPGVRGSLVIVRKAVKA